jgi:hypothetical protein
MNHALISVSRSLARASALFSICTLAAAQANNTVAAQMNVPPSPYADQNHPKCGNAQPIAEILKNPEFRKTVAKINAKAGAIAIAVSEVNNTGLKSGGDFSKWFRGVSGQPSYSACHLSCVRGSPGAKATSIYLSRRNGATGTLISGDVAIVDSLDFSGWRDVTVFTDEQNRPTVCATATNWSHDESANKVLRMTFAEEVGDCGNYTKIAGQTWVDRNPADVWNGTWDFKTKTLESTNRNGIKVTGTLDGRCEANRVYFNAMHADGSVCTCNLTRAPERGAAVSGNCTCAGTGVIMKGTLK